MADGFSYDEREMFAKYVDKRIFRLSSSHTSSYSKENRNITLTCKLDGFDYIVVVNIPSYQVSCCFKIYNIMLKVLNVIFNNQYFSKNEMTVHDNYFDGVMQEILEWKETYERIKIEEKLKKEKIIDKDFKSMSDKLTPFVKYFDLSPYEIIASEHIDAAFSIEMVTPKMEMLIKILMIRNASEYNRFIRLAKHNQVSYNQVGNLYKIKTKYLFPYRTDYEVGVLYTKIHDNLSGFWSFQYQVMVFDHDKKKFVQIFRTYQYSSSLDMLDIDNLPIKVYTEDIYRIYYQRGLAYMKYVSHIHNMYNDGLFSNYYSNVHLSGRVIVDDGYFKNSKTSTRNEDEGGEEETKIDSKFSKEIYYNLADHEIDTCTPFVNCFSLDFQRWGYALITNLTQIKYRDDAFDMLCFDEIVEGPGGKKMKKKDLIYKMVTNFNKIDRSDFIDGKTGGLVVLLHGPPGVGKTLTAEVVAEILHKPLCKISSGSLGTTPVEVEESLVKHLKNTKRWSGIALIDEVDSFIEKRGGDIIKNAICCAFLRNIEYCDSIVFFTSNRVECIDAAMESRIDLILQYDELTVDAKTIICINKLAKLGITESYDSVYEVMAKYPHLNGRNLKSIIKSAQYVAYPNKPTLSDIHAVIELMENL